MSTNGSSTGGFTSSPRVPDVLKNHPWTFVILAVLLVAAHIVYGMITGDKKPAGGPGPKNNKPAQAGVVDPGMKLAEIPMRTTGPQGYMQIADVNPTTGQTVFRYRADGEGAALPPPTVIVEGKIVHSDDPLLGDLKGFSEPIGAGQRRTLRTPPLRKGERWPPEAFGLIRQPLPSKVRVNFFGGDHCILVFSDGSTCRIPEDKPVSHLPYYVRATVDGQVIQLTARPRGEDP